MDIVHFIKKVEKMRSAQKKCSAFPDPTIMRNLKTYEIAVDNEIVAYYKEEAEKLQGTFFVDEH